MEDCVSKDAMEIIKKVYQALSLVEERLADVVYGSEDQRGEDKLKRTRDNIDELCKKHPWLRDPWLREVDTGYMVQA